MATAQDYKAQIFLESLSFREFYFKNVFGKTREMTTTRESKSHNLQCMIPSPCSVHFASFFDKRYFHH